MTALSPGAQVSEPRQGPAQEAEVLRAELEADVWVSWFLPSSGLPSPRRWGESWRVSLRLRVRKKKDQKRRRAGDHKVGLECSPAPSLLMGTSCSAAGAWTEGLGCTSFPSLRGILVFPNLFSVRALPAPLCLHLPPFLLPTSHFPLGNVKVQDAETWVNTQPKDQLWLVA